MILLSSDVKHIGTLCLKNLNCALRKRFRAVSIDSFEFLIYTSIKKAAGLTEVNDDVRIV